MLIRSKRKQRPTDAPQRHQNHGRPMTRRELSGQGFMAGSATVLGGGVLSLFSNPRAAYAAMGTERGQHDPWTTELVRQVEAERRALLPLSEWQRRVRWRDRELMSVISARRRNAGNTP